MPGDPRRIPRSLSLLTWSTIGLGTNGVDRRACRFDAVDDVDDVIVVVRVLDRVVVVQDQDRVRAVLACPPEGLNDPIVATRACATERRVLVRPPVECDAAMRRDGIEVKPPPGTGERAWWLGA